LIAPDAFFPAYTDRRACAACRTGSRRFHSSPCAGDGVDQRRFALAAKIDSEALMVRTADPPGTTVEVAFGGMEPLTRYTVAMRAIDACNVAGPYVVAELTTTKVHFTQLSGCFVATAAYGSSLEPEVEALRVARDALKVRSPLFAAATDLYYRAGPAAAAVISRSEAARALVRAALRPVAGVARAVGPVLTAR
jgi:hypothetical protein